MRKTNLIIKVREFGPSIDPYFGIETIIADDEKARMVTEKYNDIAEATKATDTSYYTVPLSLASAKKDNDDNVPF